MDPLTALSLAVNVVQCVDWSRQIVCKAKELYRSASGTSRDISEQETVTHRLKDLIDRVKDLQPRIQPKNRSPNLDRICTECISISDELLRRLQRLKVPQNAVEGRLWKSFRQALKSVWSKNAIDGIASRLSSLRDEMTTEIIVITRYAGCSTLVVECQNRLG